MEQSRPLHSPTQEHDDGEKQEPWPEQEGERSEKGREQLVLEGRQGEEEAEEEGQEERTVNTGEEEITNG